MTKKENNALWETAKFIARVAILTGVPAVLAQLALDKPEWGVWLGIAVVIFDKLVHEDKSIKAKGLLPF